LVKEKGETTKFAKDTKGQTQVRFAHQALSRSLRIA
jgi:hypothetical protein